MAPSPTVNDGFLWALWLSTIPYGLWSEEVARPSMKEYVQWLRRLERIFAGALDHFGLDSPRGHDDQRSRLRGGQPDRGHLAQPVLAQAPPLRPVGADRHLLRRSGRLLRVGATEPRAKVKKNRANIFLSLLPPLIPYRQDRHRAPQMRMASALRRRQPRRRTNDPPAHPQDSVPHDLIIFDCDGVLIDSEVIGTHTLLETLGAHGLDVDIGYVRKTYLGRTLLGGEVGFLRLTGRTCPGTFEADFLVRLSEVYRRELERHGGRARAARGLRCPYCMATSSSIERATMSLEVTGLLPAVRGQDLLRLDGERTANQRPTSSCTPPARSAPSRRSAW